MKRILVGIDGSACSLKAVDCAAELASKLDADLVFIGASQPVLIADQDVAEYARYEHMTGDVMEALEEITEKNLSLAAQRARDRGARRVETIAAVGDPAEEILSYARNNGADLVVVGSRGHGRLAGLLLGSVSQKLVIHSPCSVLVVR